jgi:hypothetical protein
VLPIIAPVPAPTPAPIKPPFSRVVIGPEQAAKTAATKMAANTDKKDFRIRALLLVGSILPLLLDLFEFFSLALQLGLIGLDLPLLLLLFLVLALKLVTHQSAGSQSEQPADRRACARASDRAADDSSHRGPAQRANTGALFPSRHRAAGAGDRTRHQERTPKPHEYALHVISSLF